MQKTDRLYLAEKLGSAVTLELVDQAASELETDRYVALLQTAPKQMQAAMAAVIETLQRSGQAKVGTGEVYDRYKSFCQRADLHILTSRVFGDLLAELDLYSVVRSRIISRGRYGRTREISLDISVSIIEKIYTMVLNDFQMTKRIIQDQIGAKTPHPL